MLRPGPVLVMVALLSAAGCQDGPGGPSVGGGASRQGPTCTRTCDTEYDTCTERFSGVGGGPITGHSSTDPTSDLGPNDICPDQLKACLRRCNL